MRRCAFFAALMALGLLGSRALADSPSDAPANALAAVGAPATGPAAAPTATGPIVGKFFQAHCVECHGADTQEGGLRLDTLSADFGAPASFAVWVKIHDRIQNGEMPPKSSPQPAPEERRSAVESLGSQLAEADVARRRAEGRAVLRRLNRTEYENTLRDLFDLPGLKLKDLLPEDGRAFGFDKSAAGLDLSYVQLAKYMEAADAALDAAIALHAARPMFLKAHIPAGGSSLGRSASNGETVFLKDFKYDDSLTPIPRELNKEAAKALNAKLPYNGTMGVFRCEDESYKPRFPFTVVHAGRYKIKMSVWSFMWDKGEVQPSPRSEIAELVANGRTLGYFDAPSLKPTVTEIEVWLNPMVSPNDHIQFNAASLKPVKIYYRKGLAAEYVGPGIAVDWLDIEGPLLDQWPPTSHRRLFGDMPLVTLPPIPKKKGKAKDKEPPPADLHRPKRPDERAFMAWAFRGHSKPFIENADSLPTSIEFSTVASQDPVADARRLLADFLPRAFRRPVTPDEVQHYVELCQARLSDGDMFEVAMRTVYQAALCSPDFLYLKERSGELEQRAMASRLSYFLWDSMPDDELIALADQGRLHDAAVLRSQVERMLEDPKAERFIDDFTDQWLDLSDIDSTTPDGKLYPEFRRILRDAMQAETREFFRELVEKDLGAANVVDSDFAMLNQRLAEHYHIPGIIGSALRRVSLPADCVRGGLMTQASVLKVTANGTVTSPVKRGAWVMRKIVGRPPDPPPGDVPAIEPDVRGATTIREMLAKHRSDATCAACHAKIDPPGFALESFDVIGGWQVRYRSLNEEGEVVDTAQTYQGQNVRYTWGPPVDCVGEMPDGQSFADIKEFKKLLLEDPRAIARNIVGQLVVYATGVPVEFADRAAVEKILDKTAASQYGLRSLIQEVVQSTLFQTK